MITAKIVILGDASVGKTNIMTQYTSNKFEYNLISTIGVEFATKKIQVKDKSVNVRF